tara:strand:+ start:2902 stop:3984 length:1083 start_codon:yes stop_codon:yes gene_type:complete
MDLYRLQIPLDSYDIITGSTIVSGVTQETGYVWLTKTGDTFVNLFLTSDYDDIGIYTDFADRDIFEMITTIPTGSGNTQYVAVAPPCVGEIININMSGGEFDLLTIDPGGQYETHFNPTGGTMCLPFGCYDVRYSSSSGGIFNIKDEYGNLINIEGAPRDDSEGVSFEGENLIEGNFCIKCKTGKLAIATYQSSGYTGATAYVMATSQCLTWTVTGTTSNNIMEIYPIAGISQLSTSVHAKYDANENPIEVTLIYGNPTSGADYDVGSGSTIISYSTPDVNNVNSSFNFERECCEECYGLNTKEEMKMGWVFDPKINVNVFIDRGQNSVFDKFLRLSEVNNNDELLDYDNNYFKVNKEQI